MQSTKIKRLSSVAIIAAGVGLAVVPEAAAATPAPAWHPCFPGGAFYPPGTCTYSFNFFVPIQVVTQGNTITVIVNGQPAFQVVMFWLSPTLTATATTDAQGQAHVTVNTAALPVGTHTLSAKAPNGAVGQTGFTVAPPATGASAPGAVSPSSNTAAGDARTLTAASGPGQIAPQGAAATQDAQAIAPASYVLPAAGSTGALASTGSNAIIPMSIIGAMLIAAGGTAVVVTRRRRNTPTDY
jgi:LPXTG-motif cell wall-anchored protein